MNIGTQSISFFIKNCLWIQMFNDTLSTMFKTLIQCVFHLVFPVCFHVHVHVFLPTVLQYTNNMLFCCSSIGGYIIKTTSKTGREAIKGHKFKELWIHYQKLKERLDWNHLITVILRNKEFRRCYQGNMFTSYPATMTPIPATRSKRIDHRKARKGEDFIPFFHLCQKEL